MSANASIASATAAIFAKQIEELPMANDIGLDCSVKIYEVNDCLIDLRLREIVHDDHAYKPEAEVFDTLIYLIEHGGETLCLDDFRTQVWHNPDTSEFEIVRAIMKARRAILDDEALSLIRYEADVPGYRFCGDVLELEII